jgi:hypothetical protein
VDIRLWIVVSSTVVLSRMMWFVTILTSDLSSSAACLLQRALKIPPEAEAEAPNVMEEIVVVEVGAKVEVGLEGKLKIGMKVELEVEEDMKEWIEAGELITGQVKKGQERSRSNSQGLGGSKLSW